MEYKTFVAKDDWQSVSLKKDLLNQLKESPDAKYMSLSALANRAIDDWLANREQRVTVSQLQQSLTQWSEEDRMNAFLLLARYIAADLITQDQNADQSLALKCWQAVVQGQKLDTQELTKLATALNVDPETLQQQLSKLWKTNGSAER